MGHEFNRREFLNIGVLGVLGVWGFLVPDSWKSFFKESKESKERGIYPIPEYLKELNSVFISADFSTKQHINEFSEFFKKLPDYTNIIILSKKNTLNLDPFQGLGISKDRIKVINIDDLFREGVDIKAQSFFETYINENGEVGAIFSNSDMNTENDKYYSDKTKTSGYIFGKDHTKEAPFYFEGGDLCSDFDSKNNTKRIFVGYRNVETTMKEILRKKNILLNQASQEAKQEALQEAKKLFVDYFEGSEVIFVGEENQTALFDNLNLNILPLGDNKMVVVSVAKENDNTDTKKETENKFLFEYQQGQLEKIKIQMQNLGYDVVELEHTIEDIISGAMTLNAIPFVDKITGQKKIIFPVFPNEIIPKEERQDKHLKTEDLTQNYLTGKAYQAYDIFKKLGYEPIPVYDDFFYKKLGSWGGIVNVIN